MTTSVLTSSIALPSAGPESGRLIGVPIRRALYSSIPPAQFRYQPETRTAQAINREPVILPLLERLAELRSTPACDRWPGADWPAEDAFQDARKFTERLPGTMRVAPHISLADDGEVNFTWSRDGLRIDLGFFGTGAYSFYGRDKGGEEYFGDDIPAASPLPEELVALLTG